MEQIVHVVTLRLQSQDSFSFTEFLFNGVLANLIQPNSKIIIIIIITEICRVA